MLRVTFSKLQKYTESQGGYDFEKEGDRITLSFVPSFPEALEKGWESNSAPRVIMHGLLENGSVNFYSVEVEDDHELRAKDYETAEFTYRSWLQFIEDNY